MTDQNRGSVQLLGNEVADVVRKALEQLFASLDSQANSVAAVASLCEVQDEVLLHLSSSLAGSSFSLLNASFSRVAAAAL